MQAYTLGVEAYEASGLPKEIFVFQVAATKEADDMFVNVATLADISEYPATAADLGREIPYYRLAKVSLVFRDMSTLAETKRMIYDDINALVRSCKAQASVAVQEEVNFDGSQSSTDIPWDSSPLPQ